jgi:hypothetical protein
VFVVVFGYPLWAVARFELLLFYCLRALDDDDVGHYFSNNGLFCVSGRLVDDSLAFDEL